jgi:hypothetical protein
MIIALSGKKKSGKDTIANFLVKDQGFTKLSFATPLKDLLIKVFRIDPDSLYNEDKKDKELDYYITIDYSHLDDIREIISEEWGVKITYEMRENIEEFFGKEIKTPRQLMQVVGTDIIRNEIDDEIFINLLIEKTKTIQTPIVIADVRLENERNKLLELGAILGLVKRDFNRIDEDEHISENDLGDEDEYDLVIENNIDITQLRSEINMWYTLTCKK